MNSNELRQILRSEIRTALVLAPAPHPLPPHDLEAESIVLATVLAGLGKRESLYGLYSEDFFSDAMGQIWRAIVRRDRCTGCLDGGFVSVPSRAEIAEQLSELGVSFPLLDEELDVIEEQVPVCVILGPKVKWIKKLKAMRDALASLETACAALRRADPCTAEHNYNVAREQIARAQL